MEEYSLIRIKVLAPAEEINGSNEMALFDELCEIERELEEWLNQRAIKTKFKLEIEDDY